MSTHLRAVKANKKTGSAALANTLASNHSIFADRRLACDRRKRFAPELTPTWGCRRSRSRRDRTTFTPNWWLHTSYVDLES